MSQLNVISRTQVLTVDPATGFVSVTNAGPPGPAGPAGGPTGPTGPQGPPGFSPFKEFSTEPVNWGEQFRDNIINNSDSNLIRILDAGDSIDVGEGANTDYRLGGYMGLSIAELQAEFGDGGSGFMGAGWLNTPGATASKITTTGAWTQVDDTGLLGRRSLKPTTAGNGAIVSGTIRGTTAKIWFLSLAAYGVWDYRIDGGSWIPVDLNNVNDIIVVTVSGLASGTHTVDVRATAGDGRWLGYGGYNANGVVLDNVSVTGTRITDYAVQTAGLTGAGGDPYKNTMIYQIFKAFAPVHLFIMPMGINDIIFDVTDTTWQADEWDALACVGVGMDEFGPSAGIRPDVLAIAKHAGKADIIAGFSLWERDWLQMHSIIRDYADTVGAAFIDVWARGGRSWAAFATENVWAGGNTDIVHLNDIGCGIMKDMVLEMLDVT
jgi:hypothetical protein